MGALIRFFPEKIGQSSSVGNSGVSNDIFNL